MGEQGSGKGAWAGLILAVVVAAVFAALWFMRGGEMDALRSDMARAESSATSTVGRLEGELATARNSIAAETKKAADLETRLADELRRAQEAGRTAESRLRTELAMANEQLTAANTKAAELEQTAAAAAERAAVIPGLESRIKELTYTHDEARKSAAAAAQELAKAKESLKAATDQANAEKARLEARVNDAVAQSTAASKEAAALRESAAEAQAAAEKERAAANETIAALRKNVADLQAAATAAAGTTARAPAAATTQAAAPVAAQATAAPAATAAVAAEVTRLTTALAAAEKARSEVAGQLAAARKLSVERETAHRGASETLQLDIAALRNEITALRESATGNATPELTRLTAALSAAEKSRVDLAAQFDAFRRESGEREAELRAAGNAARAASEGLRADLAAARADTAALRKTAGEAEKIIGELSAQFTAANASREQLLRQNDDLRQRFSVAGKRVAELETALVATNTALQAEAAVAARRTVEFEAALLALRAESVAARASREQLLKQADGLRQRLSAARKHVNELEAAAAGAAVNVPAITNAAPPALTLIRNPQEHSGKIVELLSDGKTWLLGVAGAKDMKVGTRLDIHRDADNRIAYIGQLEIVKLLPNGFAMAVVRPDEAPVGICPATGRAVRFAQESPFARTADGKPIALVRSAAPAVPATPAVGDAVDCQF